MPGILPDRNVLAAAIATLGAATAALAQPQTIDPGKWRPVVYADLQVLGEFALPYASLWADELARNNDAYTARGDKRWVVANAPATESHVVVRSPQRVITLSVLHTVTACKTLRVDAVGKAALKSCPMRLAIYQDGTSTVADAGRGCFVEYAAQPSGSAPDMVRNAALAAYDVATRTIRAGIVFAGEAAQECQFRIPIPQP